METELWRAVCAKSTCTVRREGRVTTVPTPICAIKKMSRSYLVRADGVVSSAKSLGLKSFAELTTPSAALRRLRAFLLMPQPPFLFKEGNVSALKQSVNSFTRSEPWERCCLIDSAPKGRQVQIK